MAITKRYPKGKQRYFTNDLKSLLFAFGDAPTPNIETIHMLEDVTISYLLDVIMESNKIRKLQRRTKFNDTDLKFALRRDPVKLGRIHDLITLNKEITRAKKMFDSDEKGVENGKKVKKKKNEENSDNKSKKKKSN